MEKYSSPHLRLHGNPAMKSKAGAPGAKSHVEGKDGHPAGEHLEGSQPEHVTKTHPGETQPHPATGVHAVHVHHVGGKHESSGHGGGSQGHKFMTHTHMKDGSVQTDHHDTEQAMHDHMRQQFPTSEGDDMQHDQNADNDTFAGGGSLANMSSLGGE
jgi:hypothetical protein